MRATVLLSATGLGVKAGEGRDTTWDRNTDRSTQLFAKAHNQELRRLVSETQRPTCPTCLLSSAPTEDNEGTRHTPSSLFPSPHPSHTPRVASTQRFTKSPGRINAMTITVVRQLVELAVVASTAQTKQWWGRVESTAHNLANALLDAGCWGALCSCRSCRFLDIDNNHSRHSRDLAWVRRTRAVQGIGASASIGNLRLIRSTSRR